ncbi:Uncharacterised protein [Mycobacteroides abscessus subsp. abscessus]|nr:Uncharacterised protein [Mycobacteroides abscessus subsp. abscessus]
MIFRPGSIPGMRLRPIHFRKTTSLPSKNSALTPLFAVREQVSTARNSPCIVTSSPREHSTARCAPVAADSAAIFSASASPRSSVSRLVSRLR